jgi:hypothetical protein
VSDAARIVTLADILDAVNALKTRAVPTVLESELDRHIVRVQELSAENAKLREEAVLDRERINALEAERRGIPRNLLDPGTATGKLIEVLRLLDRHPGELAECIRVVLGK